jgi:SAM-dependent methyltransferase
MKRTEQKSAIKQWNTRVEGHNAQTERVRGPEPEGEDFYDSLTSHFSEDPRRTDDPVVERLAAWVSRGTTALDVGGGAGRYALPLALRGARVTVVEPSESMIRALEEAAAGMGDLRVVQATWEEAKVEPAEVVLCAHVLHAVADIQRFVRKLAAHARERLAILAHVAAPPSMVSPFWGPVHGEERTNLPGLPELVQVLWDMEIYPNVEMLPVTGRHAVPNREIALIWLRRLLHVEPGTEKDERLLAAMPDLTVETSDGLMVKGFQPRSQGLVWWKTT